MARWSVTNPPPVGNPTGKNGSARAKLQRKYLDAYLAEFEKSGAASIKILAKEDPAAFLKIGLHFFPREISIEHTNAMTEMTDEELSALLERAQQALRIIDVTPNREALPAPKGKS
jgi:hypothetical protein